MCFLKYCGVWEHPLFGSHREMALAVNLPVLLQLMNQDACYFDRLEAGEVWEGEMVLRVHEKSHLFDSPPHGYEAWEEKY